MHNNLEDNVQTKGLLDDLHTFDYSRRADKSQRLVNFVIDFIISNALGFMFAIGMIVMITAFNPEMSDSDPLVWCCLLLYYVGRVGYYAAFEFGNAGRTIGKMVTATYAVRENGDPLTFRDAFLRSLCRLVPFEPFSGLTDDTWHDAWTKTWVIKK
jgi:uncharacterized RDD family membrane protein YckC